MSSFVTEWGPFAAVAILVIYKLFDILKTQINKRDGAGDERRVGNVEILTEINYMKEMVEKIQEENKDYRADYYKTRELIKDLHTWHNQVDEDGVRVWYVKRSLEQTVQTLVEVVRANSEVMRQIKVVLESR